MRKRRLIRCGGAMVEPIEGELPVDLALWGDSRNIELKVEDIGGPLVAGVPPMLTDLLEVATYIYCADQAVTRGGDTGGTLGSLWRRGFRFVIPVREPAVWSRPGVLAALSGVLGFLSDDEFDFEFIPLDKGPPLQEYLEFGGTNPTGIEVDEVMLFSGGLDSLAGACDTLFARRKRAAFITHRSASKLYGRQDRLIQDLRDRTDRNRFLYMPVRVKKNQKLSREFTQRTRSFLYACLAAVAARMLGVPGIRFFGNGAVSINLPLAEQVIGARSTRTTHPRAIAGFQALFEALFEEPFSVENPFIWKTKTDIVHVIAANGCHDLIEDSVSCTRVYNLTNLHTHCGACYQCIDRRFAILAAGMERYDPAYHYRLDLLTAPRDKGEPRTMAELYYMRATQLKNVDDAKFFGRYGGEVARTLRYLLEDPDTAAKKIVELHRRHGDEVVTALQNGIGQHVQALLAGALPDTCLLMFGVPEQERNNLVEEAKEAAAPSRLGDAKLQLTRTSRGFELDGVVVVTNQSRGKVPILEYLVSVYADDIKGGKEASSHRFHRVEQMSSVLDGHGKIKKNDPENVRRNLNRMRAEISKRYWNGTEPHRSLSFDDVVESVADQGYRLNPVNVVVLPRS